VGGAKGGVKGTSRIKGQIWYRVGRRRKNGGEGRMEGGWVSGNVGGGGK